MAAARILLLFFYAKHPTVNNRRLSSDKLPKICPVLTLEKPGIGESGQTKAELVLGIAG